ncbi:MAG: IS30 family transposase [Lachnospiraceae bacterium]|nr:IS30 family transposase [Lachnospiraceae bacterium]
MPFKPKGRHLTASERGEIEGLLKAKHTIRYIAQVLHCSPSTISREIRNHAVTVKPKMCDCIHVRNCTNHRVCNPSATNQCKKLCRTCPHAMKKCPDYAKAYCDELIESKLPVCNFCCHRRGCHYEHKIYDAKRAQAEADNMLHECRSGYDLTAGQLERIDAVVTPLINRGQSIYHILQEHGEELGVSESTLRRMINDCVLDARRIDLRDAVRRKPRRKRKDNNYKTMKTIKEGHLYSDFLKYIRLHDVAVVQMDTVEGIRSDKAAILTLHFCVAHIQLGLMLNEQSSAEVVSALDRVEQALGTELFTECFPVILTDNGHEFADIDGMERSINGGQRTRIFFCEPNRSDEKGSCENNHKYIRYIIPKGSSLEKLTQTDISCVMDHVNSFARKSLHGRTPYQVGRALLPEDLFTLLGLTEIPADDVMLTPELFKKLHPSK